MLRNSLIALAAIVLGVARPSAAQDFSAFHEGPIFTEFGAVARVDPDVDVPANMRFSVAFDVVEPAGESSINRSVDTAARFVNMHVLHGVPQENIEVALVVHGKASFDVMNREAYAARFAGRDNLTSAALEEMMAKGVKVYVCGQSAKAHGIVKEDLVPGVQVTISAMTAHAMLQQQGFTLNPF
ncbi:DsrE family protein [Tsuneonella sp. SYSU-LHT278]|uniref:DsrE family protein n=1 Tax=Tsuneonella sediminis TaxID=3416089 RepID=UPI003F7AF81E